MRLTAHTMVMVVGLCTDQDLYRSLKDSVSSVHLVGDAGEARNITHAIWDGYEASRNI